MTVPLDHLLMWLSTYKYAVLFPATIIEGPIVTILAGFLISSGYFNGLTVYGTVVIGDLVGDSLYYGLGRWSRLQFINHWGKLIGLTPERLALLEKHFHEHGTKTLIIGKITHGLGGVILIAAGAAHIPYRRYIWINLLGTIPKSLVLLLVGYYFGQAYTQLNRYINYTGLGMIILIILIILFYVTGMKKIMSRLDTNHDLPL